MNLRRLFFVYLSALTFLLVSVVASMVITDLSAGEIVDDAAKINLAGRQRMLSQRIIYLAEDLSLQDGEAPVQTREDLSRAIEAMASAVHLFETSHATLSGDPALAQSTHDLYFQTDDAGQTLHERVESYLGHARGVLEDPSDISSLNGLRAIERGGLLGDLDAIVANIERQFNERVATLLRLERGSLFLAIAIILVEIALVFLPGHRMLQKAMDDLTTQRNDLKEAYETSEALRQEQAEFTYSVSHDLKSPANSIGMILEELSLDEADRLSEDGIDLIQEATAIVERIGVQVEDILQYAEATSTGYQLEEIALQPCVEDILQDLRHDILTTSATVTVTADVQMQGYRRQVTTLLQNLIANALKFKHPDQSPEVTVDATVIDADGTVRITVKDNGIGIEPDHHARIFKLFERLHTRDRYQGTGLGLATCKRIADNHRGSIQVTSVLNEGSCFNVILRNPVAQDERHEERLAA